MKKTKAIEIFGEKVVNKAMEMYETDFGKILFEEDCRFENDCAASSEEVITRLYAAKYVVNNV